MGFSSRHHDADLPYVPPSHCDLRFQQAPREFIQRLAPRRASAFFSASRLARLAPRPTLGTKASFWPLGALYVPTEPAVVRLLRSGLSGLDPPGSNAQRCVGRLGYGPGLGRPGPAIGQASGGPVRRVRVPVGGFDWPARPGLSGAWGGGTRPHVLCWQPRSGGAAVRCNQHRTCCVVGSRAASRIAAALQTRCRGVGGHRPSCREASVTPVAARRQGSALPAVILLTPAVAMASKP
jgi:hypothetical protein